MKNGQTSAQKHNENNPGRVRCKNCLWRWPSEDMPDGRNGCSEWHCYNPHGKKYHKNTDDGEKGCNQYEDHISLTLPKREHFSDIELSGSNVIKSGRKWRMMK